MERSENFPYRRILIVGCGGAGKSTLAVEMGKQFALPVAHLDKLWWLPDWQSRTREEFDALLEQELSKREWIIEGNFKRTFSKRLQYADFCVFLDYPERLCIDSVYARTKQYRGKTRPDMTEGCPERIDSEFEEWIRSYRSTARPQMLAELEQSLLPYKVFSSREETAAWLKEWE